MTQMSKPKAFIGIDGGKTAGVAVYIPDSGSAFLATVRLNKRQDMYETMAEIKEQVEGCRVLTYYEVVPMPHNIISCMGTSRNTGKLLARLEDWEICSSGNQHALKLSEWHGAIYGRSLTRKDDDQKAAAIAEVKKRFKYDAESDHEAEALLIAVAGSMKDFGLI